MKFGKKENVSEKEPKTESNLLDSIKFGEKSLLVTAEDMKVYQMIDCGDKFLFLRLTKEKFSPITDFENIPENEFGEIYNLVIEKSSIVSVDITEFDSAKMTEIDLTDYCIGADLNIKFKAENEEEQFVEKIFSIWYEAEAEQLEKFFSGVDNVNLNGKSSKKYADMRTRFTVEAQPDIVLPSLKVINLVKKLNIISFLLCVIFAYFLIKSNDNHAISVTDSAIKSSLLCIIFSAAVLLIYFIYNKDVTFSIISQFKVKRLKEDICLPLIFPCMIISFVSSMMDITLTNFTLYFVIACVCTIILILLFFILSKESKKISAMICYVIIVIMFSFGSIRILNCSFDLRQPTSTEMMVTDTHMVTSEHDFLTYSSHKFTLFFHYIECEDGNVYRTSADDYEYIMYGDTVTVVEHSGLLGIPWAEVKADTSSKTRTERYQEFIGELSDLLAEESKATD